MKVKLTDVLIKKRLVPEVGREELFDTQVPGFGIRIGQRERAFFLIRRVNGKKARFSLGQYPSITLSKARADAHDILDRIKKGEDPRAENKRRKLAASEDAENTFGKIAERFLAEYCEGKKTPLRRGTVAGYRWALLGEPAGAWQSQPLSAITDRDVIGVIDWYEKREKFGAARLFKTYLNKFMNWSIAKRLLEKNPASNAPLGSTPIDFKRDRVLSPAELRMVMAAANIMPNPSRAFILMLVFCGQRRGETSLMRWNDLKLDGVKLPSSMRTDDHRILGQPQTPMSAIRAKCIDCSGGSKAEGIVDGGMSGEKSLG